MTVYKLLLYRTVDKEYKMFMTEDYSPFSLTNDNNRTIAIDINDRRQLEQQDDTRVLSATSLDHYRF